MYRVKTRNFHCKKAVKKLLDLSALLGVVRGDSYDDGDGKYFLENASLIKAFIVWLYFMALSPWSGGWTYIIGQEQQIGGGKLKSWYL